MSADIVNFISQQCGNVSIPILEMPLMQPKIRDQVSVSMGVYLIPGYLFIRNGTLQLPIHRTNQYKPQETSVTLSTRQQTQIC